MPVSISQNSLRHSRVHLQHLERAKLTKGTKDLDIDEKDDVDTEREEKWKTCMLSRGSVITTPISSLILQSILKNGGYTLTSSSSSTRVASFICTSSIVVETRQRHGTIPTERQKNRKERKEEEKKKDSMQRDAAGTIETIERNIRYLLRRTNVATALLCILVPSFGKERRREKKRTAQTKRVDTIHERQKTLRVHTGAATRLHGNDSAYSRKKNNFEFCNKEEMEIMNCIEK